MDVQSFFEQAKTTLKLTQSTPLQSAYQFGSDPDKLAQLVLTGTKRLPPALMTYTKLMNHCQKWALMTSS